MPEKEKPAGSLIVRDGVSQPPAVNPDIDSRIKQKSGRKLCASSFLRGITQGDRAVLGQAITLIESNNPKHFDLAQEVVEKCLPFSNKSLRIGISGIPGAGKSTFIEAFGTMLTEAGHRVAVLAIDPSSVTTGGSILGDKTRMERLSTNPGAFIRPSPSAGTLGGVARKTRETIILCEAAGFDVILVETVGVGQSETAVATMVDFFILLMVAGAGDELQGIKRGIMEIADLVAINKADGENKIRAEHTASEFRNAVHFFPAPPSGIPTQVVTCSSKYGDGIREIWSLIEDYVRRTEESGYFLARRKEQNVQRMNDFIENYLKESFYNDRRVTEIKPLVEKQLREGEITSYKGAYILLNKFLDK